MKQSMLWTAIGIIALLAIGSIFYMHRRATYKESEGTNHAKIEALMREAYDAKLKDCSCKKRGDALEATIDTLTREAHAKLKIGTKKDAIVRFFAESNIPVEFYGNEASGIISTTGCSPLGCGTDRGYIRLRMDTDEEGTETSEPKVDSMYADCL